MVAKAIQSEQKARRKDMMCLLDQFAIVVSMAIKWIKGINEQEAHWRPGFKNMNLQLQALMQINTSLTSKKVLIQLANHRLCLLTFII